MSGELGSSLELGSGELSEEETKVGVMGKIEGSLALGMGMVVVVLVVGVGMIEREDREILLEISLPVLHGLPVVHWVHWLPVVLPVGLGPAVAVVPVPVGRGRGEVGEGCSGSG